MRVPGQGAFSLGGIFDFSYDQQRTGVLVLDEEHKRPVGVEDLGAVTAELVNELDFRSGIGFTAHLVDGDAGLLEHLRHSDLIPGALAAGQQWQRCVGREDFTDSDLKVVVFILFLTSTQTGNA